MDPPSEVLLHQWGQTMKREYKVNMRSDIQLLVVEKYYQQQFGWTNSEYDKVD